MKESPPATTTQILPKKLPMKNLPPSTPRDDFPRLSIGGTVILAVNLIIALGLFHLSSYGDALWSRKRATTATSLNIFVFLTSLLNVLSHGAVVLGALHDTFVISILIGVGFDVLTRMLQLYWWMELVQMVHTVNSLIDSCLLGSLSLLFLYQIRIHIRALLLVNNDSLERMQTVLQGALNNLRGVPGDGWKDHLFAYSDLSLHLIPCLISAVLLNQQGQTHSIVPVLLLTFGTIALAPLQTGNYKKNATKEVMTTKHGGLPLELMQIASSQGDPRIHVLCTCNSCSHRMKRTGSKSTFVCNPFDGLCSLWMLSFEEVHAVLHNAVRQSNNCDPKKR